MSIVRQQGILELQFQVPEGIIECVIQHVLYMGKDAYEVDVWRTDKFLASSIVHFSSWFVMAFDGQRFRIVEPRSKRVPYNQFWADLEVTVANHIMVNT